MQNIPPIDREEEVVEWFLKNDDKIKDDWINPVMFKRAKEEITSDIKKYSDSQSLRSFIGKVAEFHSKILDVAADEHEKNGSVSADFSIIEKLIAAKMRILGYFLLKKYGINPSDIS